MRDKINIYIDKLKKNHPTIYNFIYKIFNNKLIILFFWGLIVWGTIIPAVTTPLIAPYVGSIFSYADDIEPELLGTMPNNNERLIKPPDRILIGFRDKGGSGINKVLSSIELVGSIHGAIEEKNIFFQDDGIVFIPNETLEPDFYTVHINLIDKGENIRIDSFSFYVLENPNLNVSLKKYGEKLKEIYVNKTNPIYHQYDYYFLLLNNRNDTILENVVFIAQFPGIIVNYSIFEIDGISNYHVKQGLSTIFWGLQTTNITSCTTKINIDRIFPDGAFLILFYIDTNIWNYNNAMWCRSDIFDSNYNIIRDSENTYEYSYNFQEYGFWYHKSNSDKIGEIIMDFD